MKKTVRNNIVFILCFITLLIGVIYVTTRVFEPIGAVLGIDVFIIIGICCLAIPRYILYSKKSRCTFHVEARCIRIKEWVEHDGASHKTYKTPIWKYNAGDKSRTYKENYDYRDFELTHKIGDNVVLYLNPDDFSDVYYPQNESLNKSDIVGIACIFLGIMCILGL